MRRRIATPVQPLACKIGQRTIARFEADTMATSRAGFDSRPCHAQALMAAPLPMRTLEKTLDAWFAREEARGWAAMGSVECT